VTEPAPAEDLEAATAAELLDALDGGPELDERELWDLDLNECNDWAAP
jgi:hypothetical protein